MTSIMTPTVPGNGSFLIDLERQSGSRVALYILSGILSVMFNVASLFVLWSDRLNMDEVELIFIRALSAQDLLSGVFISIWFTYQTLSPATVRQPLVCGVMQTVNFVLAFQAQLSLLLITFDKYLKITMPFMYLQ